MLMPLLWWFGETTLVAGALALVATALCRIRRLDASTRHLLWLIVLIKLVMPPLVRSPWTLDLPELDIAWMLPAEAPAPLPAATLPAPALITETPAVCSEPVCAEAEPPAFHPVLVALQADHEPPDADAVQPAAIAAVPAPDPRPLPRPLAASPAIAAESPFMALGRWLLLSWGAVTLAIALRELTRIAWFQARVRRAVPAPVWLVEETERLAQSLEVDPPDVLVVPGMGTPVVWCLTRPRLLLPGHLVKSLDATRWKGILAHELAHLHRGDHWVGRLQLVAGLVWWWNPIYWLTRRRLEAEAELACDAWVVRIFPDDRLAYADVLLQVCTKLSQPGAPAPALGITGSGRFFERRLHMILDDRSPSRRSFPMLLAICALALLALPTWTRSTAAAIIPLAAGTGAASIISEPPADSDRAEVSDVDDEDSSAAADDESDADDDDDQKKAEKDSDEDEAADEIEKKIEDALGPDFEKKIEDWAERFGKKMEEQFGENSEFTKQMEAFGKKMEERFGENSEFTKQMEAFGKEMEKKFGEDSEFAKTMEGLGKEMEKKFGDDSEFARKVKEKFGEDSEFAKKMKEKFGEDSEFAKKMKEQFGENSEFVKQMKEKAELHAKNAKEKLDKAAKKAAEAKAAKPAKPATAAETTSKSTNREARIKSLEGQIKQLLREIEKLKDSDEQHEE